MPLLKTLIYQNKTQTYGFEASHNEEICHHRAETRSQARLSNEAKLKFRQTDDIVTLLPGWETKIFWSFQNNSRIRFDGWMILKLLFGKQHPNLKVLV